MTKFELFINALSRLPLDYLLSCSAEVKRSYYTTLNLSTTTKSQIKKLIAPLKKEAMLKGTSRRIELVDYVVDAFCEWRQSASNFNKFLIEREALQKEISEFIHNVDLLLKTTNYEQNRVEIKAHIQNSPKESYKILGLKASLMSIKNRARAAVTNFLKEINPICLSKYILNESKAGPKIESSIKSMLADHELFYSASNKSTKNKKEVMLDFPSKVNKFNKDEESKVSKETDKSLAQKTIPTLLDSSKSSIVIQSKEEPSLELKKEPETPSSKKIPSISIKHNDAHWLNTFGFNKNDTEDTQSHNTVKMRDW